ncbi:fimbrillin family protein [Phytoactinopolyspora endophytica]|uniref:fimbrillin family protein n=1 Tax=Phytoactinopolyspora endophytica TaxID=1642495 RepID=UPI00101BC62A|nr:fimbrillin family protein [Phytoactinopolyspora endophytica]
MSRVLRRCLAVVVLPAAVMLSGCTDNDEPEVPEVPGETDEPTGDTTATEAVDATPDPTSTLDVPFECSELMSAGRVVQILQTSLDGETQRVYNEDFLEDSGRTGRLTCRYGAPTGGETASPSPDSEPEAPAVEIAVSSYIDEETAGGRIDATLGSTSRDIEPQTMGGNEGYVLTGQDEVTFIMAEGVRTYVIALRRGVVAEAAELVVMLDLAAEMLGLDAPTPES